MKQKKYVIVYPTHRVRMVPGKSWSEKFRLEYLRDMKNELSENGTAKEHREELNNMNNDGTWVVEEN